MPAQRNCELEVKCHIRAKQRTCGFIMGLGIRADKGSVHHNMVLLQKVVGCRLFGGNAPGFLRRSFKYLVVFVEVFVQLQDCRDVSTSNSCEIRARNRGQGTVDYQLTGSSSWGPTTRSQRYL